MTWLEPQALRLLTLGCGVFLLEWWLVSLLKCTSWVWTTKGKLGLWQDLPFLMDPFLVCLNFCGRNFMLQKTLGWAHYQKEKLNFIFYFLKKEFILEVLSIQKWEKLNIKITRFVYLVFCCVAKNIDLDYEICALFIDYSQIWLNLFRDNCHFFYMFLWMIATLAAKKMSLKK